DSSVSPMLSFNYGGFAAYYKVRNLTTTQVGTGNYESFPFLDADDGYVSNVGRAGVRFKLLIQNWAVTPYVQYASNRYHINVRATAGSVTSSTAYVPTDFNSLSNAWYGQGVGAVTNTYSMSQANRLN